MRIGRACGGPRGPLSAPARLQTSPRFPGVLESTGGERKSGARRHSQGQSPSTDRPSAAEALEGPVSSGRRCLPAQSYPAGGPWWGGQGGSARKLPRAGGRAADVRATSEAHAPHACKGTRRASGTADGRSHASHARSLPRSRSCPRRLRHTPVAGNHRRRRTCTRSGAKTRKQQVQIRRMQLKSCGEEISGRSPHVRRDEWPPVCELRSRLQKLEKGEQTRPKSNSNRKSRNP